MSRTFVMSVEFYHAVFLWNEKHIFQVNIWIDLEPDKLEKWNVVHIIICVCHFPEYLGFWSTVETETYIRMCFLCYFVQFKPFNRNQTSEFNLDSADFQ